MKPFLRIPAAALHSSAGDLSLMALTPPRSEVDGGARLLHPASLDRKASAPSQHQPSPSSRRSRAAEEQSQKELEVLLVRGRGGTKTDERRGKGSKKIIPGKRLTEREEEGKAAMCAFASCAPPSLSLL